MNLVRFEYDARKDALNRAKHGVSLLLAIQLFDGPVQIRTDQRRNYGEQRQVAYGLIEGRLFVCVFTDRDDVRRVISLRKANRRERNAHRQNDARRREKSDEGRRLEED